MKNDGRLIQPGDVFHALVLLSRLPVPHDGSAGRGAAAAWAYPLAGIVIGAVAAMIGLIGLAASLPAPLLALLCLGALVMVTGALHEDGLSDTADGLWGGWSREKRLEIMKDSRIGAYGMIALFFGLAARWAALWLLFERGAAIGITGVVTAAALSRAMIPAVMAALPHARETGLSVQVGSVGRPTAAVALLIGVTVAMGAFGWTGLLAAVWAGLVVTGLALVARAKIGGQTGDILGASQQLAEIAVLFCLVA